MPRTRAGQLAAHEEVRDDVDVGAEREVLVDGLDAGRLGLGRRREAAARRRRRRCGPTVGALSAGDDLDQRRLAGAVVAEKRDHLAAPPPRRKRRAAPRWRRSSCGCQSAPGAARARQSNGSSGFAGQHAGAGPAPQGPIAGAAVRVLAGVTISRGSGARRVNRRPCALVPAGGRAYRRARHPRQA